LLVIVVASGFLILDKPSGPTSHDMVAFVRRGTGQRRAGHAGTLDPLATGVLVICLGAATRLSEYLLGESKRYLATARFGAATTTYDSQGEVTATAPVTLGRQDVEAALAEFRGDLMQTPPAYSAVKQGGRKAYELARRGQAVELEARAVTVYDLRVEAWNLPDVVLAVHCSAGAYVRSLVHDLGQRLGCGAHVTALRRTASGHFEIDQAVAEAALRRAFADGSWRQYLVPMPAGLPHWPVVQLDGAGAARIARGQAVAAGTEAPRGTDRLALGLGSGGRVLAVLELDTALAVWRPKKVLVEP
jgi:tRNA pseudouridine55 synthase